MTVEFQDVGTMLEALKPDEPIFAFYPRILQKAAQNFTGHFHGDVVYDASANAGSGSLHALYAGGIRQFAVSNLAELRAVKAEFPDATCHFTHPVKSVTAIQEAAHKFGVTHFTADHPDEVAKIIVHCAPVRPVIVVRLALGVSSYNADGSFGCSAAEAAQLLREAAAEGLGLGLSFQLDENADIAMYRRAIERVGDTVRAARVQPELIDIGGGLPSGDAVQPHSLDDFSRAIREQLSCIGLHHPIRLMASPGRTLTAAGGALVVKVELRRGNRLYLNDGVRGGLGDLQRSPSDPLLRAWRLNGVAQLMTPVLDDFIFYGPGGDSLDRLPGPYALPGDISMGDYIEIGRMGNYGGKGQVEVTLK